MSAGTGFVRSLRLLREIWIRGIDRLNLRPIVYLSFIYRNALKRKKNAKGLASILHDAVSHPLMRFSAISLAASAMPEAFPRPRDIFDSINFQISLRECLIEAREGIQLNFLTFYMFSACSVHSTYVIPKNMGGRLIKTILGQVKEIFTSNFAFSVGRCLLINSQPNLLP